MLQNKMAVLRSPVMDIFLLSATFQTYLNITYIFNQAVGPGVLQTFSTCAINAIQTCVFVYAFKNFSLISFGTHFTSS